MIGRDAFLAADERSFVEVEIPEFGEGQKLRLASIPLRDFNAIYGGGSPETELGVEIFVLLVIACAVDDDGKKIFTADDREALAGKSLEVMKRLGMACLRLNGVSGEALEEAEKNLGSGPKPDTPST